MPYAPTVNDQSGLIFAQGFSSGLDRLLAGAAKGDEKRKARKKAETILGELFPDSKDQLAGKSLAELDGLLEVATLKQARAYQERRAAQEDEQLAISRDRLGLDRDRANLDADLSRQRMTLDAGEYARRERADNAEMAAREREVTAAQAAGRPDPIAAMLDRGVGGGVLRTDVQAAARTSTPASRYLDAGGTDARMLDALLEASKPAAAQFKPTVIDLGDGNRAMTTSTKSAVPLPRPGARAAGRDPLADVLGLRKRYLDLLQTPVTANGATLASYYAQTRNADGTMKPKARIDPRAEKLVTELQQLDAQISDRAQTLRGAPAAPATAAQDETPANDETGTGMTLDEFFDGF